MTNLERLDVRALGTPDKEVMGTIQGIYAGEWEKAQKGFAKIVPYKTSVLGFLRDTNVIHG